MATNEKNNFNNLVMEENKNIEDDLPFDFAQDSESSMVNEETVQPIATAAEEKSEINEMEVHHHTHPSHGKKTWKQYGWEFLMLFLAVFCGFLAEYQLEHVIEHQREKQYLQSLVADLKSDQQALTQHIITVKSGLTMMDSMITLLNTPGEVAGNTGNLYFWARLAPRLRPLSTNNRTFEQLKNSGNFRLIKELATSNKIMAYYEKFPLVHLLESINETEFTEYKKVVAKIFDPSVLLQMEGPKDEIKRITGNPSLRTSDKELLQELSVFSVYLHGTKKGMLSATEELKTTGNELLKYLQEEYHLN
jgi:hypothetical protein